MEWTDLEDASLTEVVDAKKKAKLNLVGLAVQATLLALVQEGRAELLHVRPDELDDLGG